LADAGHIAEASRLAVHIERDRVPLSADARRVIAASPLVGQRAGRRRRLRARDRRAAAQARALLAAARREGEGHAIGAFARARASCLTVPGSASRIAQSGYVHF
jgi:thiamine-monophosphate kinase